MVYLFTALYCEAYIFIKRYNLTKNQESTWFQEFYNETAGIRLAITGVGEIAAATVVSSVCSIYKPTQEDFLLNVGICAYTAKNNGIFLCNKIVEKVTGKTFYPDMLYRHPFCEETIVTEMQPWSNNNDDAEMQPWSSNNDNAQMQRWNSDNVNAKMPAHDMEAAAVYQAGIHFFGPHQMIFLKIVSDKGTIEEVSKEQVIFLMEKYQDCIFDYIEQILAIMQKNRYYKNCLCPYEKQLEEEKQIETFCMDLHCSKAMKDSIKQYIRYLKLAGMDYTSIIQDMYKKELLPCKDKREGKIRFEEFKRRLF